MSHDSREAMPFIDLPDADNSTTSAAGENCYQLTPQAVGIYRWVTGFMLLGLLWKVIHFAWFPKVYLQAPLYDGFFPAWGRSAWVLAVLYMVAVSGAIFSLISRTRGHLQIQSLLVTVSLFALNIHQGSYNDVTFLTAVWASVWCVWFIHRCQFDAHEALVTKGAFLANIILAMILLGGAVGKWSAEYWSGEVLYQVYFVDRDFWVFNWLRQWFEQETLMVIACWYSRFVVVVETTSALALWILPRRWGSLLAILVFASIAVMSNFYLFSVLFSTIGLATVGLHRKRLNREHIDSQNRSMDASGISRSAVPCGAVTAT